MEQQYLFNDDSKWEMIQFRTSPDMKTNIHIWCKEHHISLSVVLRLVCGKILNNRRTFPGYQKEPTMEISSAVDDVVPALPIINRQRQFDPRIY